MQKKLYKSRRNIALDGVCAGLAEYFGIDVSIVRLIFVFAHFFGVPGILIYIVCAVVMPREPEYTVYNEGYNKN